MNEKTPVDLDDESMLADLFRKMLRDCMQPSCNYPCLRDDIGDWLSDEGFTYPDER